MSADWAVKPPVTHRSGDRGKIHEQHSNKLCRRRAGVGGNLHPRRPVPGRRPCRWRRRRGRQGLIPGLHRRAHGEHHSCLSEFIPRRRTCCGWRCERRRPGDARQAGPTPGLSDRHVHPDLPGADDGTRQSRFVVEQPQAARPWHASNERASLWVLEGGRRGPDEGVADVPGDRRDPEARRHERGGQQG